MLKQKNNELGNKVKELKNTLRLKDKKLANFDIERESKKVIRNKNLKIDTLNKKLNNKRKEFEVACEKKNKCEELMSLANRGFIAKKLDNLSYNNYLRQGFKIEQQDILLVQKPQCHSRKLLEIIANRQATVIYRGKVPDVLKNFEISFIPEEQLVIDETDNFALCDRHTFKKLKTEKIRLKNIVRQYQENRK